jgi:hypothetical protein
MKLPESFRLIFCIILLAAFIIQGSPVYAENRDGSRDELNGPIEEKPIDEKHWVYNELAGFKKRVYPVAGLHSEYGGISEDEKNIIRNYILNEDYLDRPIKTGYWAALLNAVLKLPGQEKEKLLEMYVYNLATGDEITREDAVGGMVKLLTVKPYLDGSITAEEMEPAKALKDLQEISNRQNDLVRIAYCEGLLDSKTPEYFRPKEKLTVAEAISMLYKVITKYNISYDNTEKGNAQTPDITTDTKPQANWIDSRLQSYRDKLQMKLVKLKTAESILLDGRVGSGEDLLYAPVTIDKWSEVLKHVLEIEDEKILHSYTSSLVSDKTVPRDIAAAGMLKLLHYTGIIEGRDASEKERLDAVAAFSDYNDAFDTSKLAIAYNEGLVRGYPDSTFRPKQALTNGEALILMLNIIDKCM